MALVRRQDQQAVGLRRGGNENVGKAGAAPRLHGFILDDASGKGDGSIDRQNALAIALHDAGKPRQQASGPFAAAGPVELADAFPDLLQRECGHVEPV